MTDKRVSESIFRPAIDYWWKSKKKNKSSKKKSQGGARDENLRGDTMDGFRDVIVEALEKSGVAKEHIFYGNHLSVRASNLPAYFRATKNWDIVICRNAKIDYDGELGLTPPRLVAAIEFKSQTTSIGNNQNNRIEESIGNATDFWDAYEIGTFGELLPRPWLGYLFVGKYGEGAEKKSVKVTQPLINIDPEFAGTQNPCWREETKFDGISYADRYRVFLERMIAKKLYDGASFLVTNDKIKEHAQNYEVLFPALSGDSFLKGLLRHVKAYYED